MENFHLAGKGCLHELNTELVFIYIKKPYYYHLKLSGYHDGEKRTSILYFFKYIKNEVK